MSKMPDPVWFEFEGLTESEVEGLRATLLQGRRAALAAAHMHEFEGSPSAAKGWRTRAGREEETVKGEIKFLFDGEEIAAGAVGDRPIPRRGDTFVLSYLGLRAADHFTVSSVEHHWGEYCEGSGSRTWLGDNCHVRVFLEAGEHE